MKTASSRLEPVVLPLVAGLLLLIAWHVAVIATRATVFPSPVAVGSGLVQLAREGTLYRYCRDSLGRVAGGFAIATLIGIPLGLLMGWYRDLARSLNPVIQIARPISPIAWIPVSIIMFGISNVAAMFLCFLGAFFVIVTSTTNAVRNITPIYLLAGRNFGLSPTMVFVRVIFPAALPQILTGLRIALGIAWLVLVAAEMIAVDSGLGYMVLDARNAGKRYDMVVAGMLVIGGIGLFLDTLLRRIELHRSVRWGFREG